MYIQLTLLLMLSMPTWASDDGEIKKVFSNYEKIYTQEKTSLVSEVFSEKFLKDHGGEKEFKESIEKMPFPAYELEIKPGQMDKDIKIVKMIPKGHKGHIDNLFILKKIPSGQWKIEGTMTNED